LDLGITYRKEVSLAHRISGNYTDLLMLGMLGFIIASRTTACLLPLLIFHAKLLVLPASTTTNSLLTIGGSRIIYKREETGLPMQQLLQWEDMCS
jgi:hypothetical protein